MEELMFTNTPILDGYRIVEYKGLVSSQIVMGANVIRDFLAALRDFFGGRSAAYEEKFQEAKLNALSEITAQAKAKGANAVLGLEFDWNTVGKKGGMMLVCCVGTAAVVERTDVSRT